MKDDATTSEEQMQILLAITDTALAHMTLDDLFRQMLSRIRITMKADNIAVLLINDDGQSMTIRAVDGLEAEIAPHVHILVGQGFAGRVAAECRPIVLQKPSLDEVLTSVLREQMASLLGVPLKVQARVIGVVHIGMRKPRQFAPSDIQLLERVAERLAIAIERASLYEKERQARQEAALRAGQLEATLAAIADGVFLYDKAGYLVYMNEAARAMLPEDDISVDQTPLSIKDQVAWLDMRDEHGEPFVEGQMPLQRVLRGEILKGDTAVDVIMRSKQQQHIQVSLSGVPIRDEQQIITGAVCLAREVTERRGKERRIREGLSSLLATAELLVQISPASRYLMAQIAYGLVEVIRSLLGCHCVGLVTIEVETRMIHPVAECGFTAEQTSAWYSSLFGSPSRLLDRLLDEDIQQRLKNNEPIVLNLENETRHASSLPSILLVTSILAELPLISVLYIDRQEFRRPVPPEELALVEALTKISALTIERERRDYERERLLASLQEANAQLEKLFESQRSFVAVVSHEFRTALTGIQGFSEMLSNETFSSEEVKECAANIHQDAMRLSSMINRFLDLEYMKSGNLAFQWEMVNLNEIVRTAIEHMRPFAPEHMFLLELDETIPQIMGDQARLLQIFNNLVANAVKYSPAGGEVLLKSGREGNQVHLSIQDRGIGIPSQALHAIFDPFSHIHAEETRYIEGPGLGLPIVKQVVQLHGGQIWAESTVGEGACLHITLPIAQDLLDTDNMEVRGAINVAQ